MGYSSKADCLHRRPFASQRARRDRPHRQPPPRHVPANVVRRRTGYGARLHGVLGKCKVYAAHTHTSAHECKRARARTHARTCTATLLSSWVNGCASSSSILTSRSWPSLRRWLLPARLASFRCASVQVRKCTRRGHKHHACVQAYLGRWREWLEHV